MPGAESLPAPPYGPAGPRPLTGTLCLPGIPPLFHCSTQTHLMNTEAAATSACVGVATII